MCVYTLKDMSTHYIVCMNTVLEVICTQPVPHVVRVTASIHNPLTPTHYTLKLVCSPVGIVTSWWITESTFAMFESAPNKVE